MDKARQEEGQSIEAGLPRAVGSVTLTVDQIKDLAEMAGLKVEGEITEDDRETEIVVEVCPPDGVKDREEDGGDGVVRHYRHIAYFADLWDEGVYPLGSPNVSAEARHVARPSVE